MLDAVLPVIHCDYKYLTEVGSNLRGFFFFFKKKKKRLSSSGSVQTLLSCSFLRESPASLRADCDGISLVTTGKSR